MSAVAHADPFAAFGTVQHAFEWLDDREERGAAPGQVGFVPQVEWVVGLGNAAAVCGSCGAGTAAWRLVTDIVYQDSFGLMKWSPGSLQVRRAPPHRTLLSPQLPRRCTSASCGMLCLRPVRCKRAPKERRRAFRLDAGRNRDARCMLRLTPSQRCISPATSVAVLHDTLREAVRHGPTAALLGHTHARTHAPADGLPEGVCRGL